MAILLSQHRIRDNGVLHLNQLTIIELRRMKAILDLTKERIEKDKMVEGGRKYEAYLSCALIIQDLALKRCFMKFHDPLPVLNWGAFYKADYIPDNLHVIRSIFQGNSPRTPRPRSM